MEVNFRRWDETLAQVLRLRVQGSPRTENESWHAITDDIHILSAFLVTTNEHAVHITSLVRSNRTKGNRTPIQYPPLVCIIRASNTTIKFKAHIRLVWTYFDPSFRNALILCPPPKEYFSRMKTYEWQSRHDIPSLGVDLTVVPFKLIMDTTVTNQHVHENGQMPALYDCIFRSLYKMEYYVHVDIDELMVPMPNFSFHAMIKEAKRISNGSFGSVMVAVRYHCVEYPKTMQYASRKFLPLQTRLFAYHSRDITHAGFTKYIARSRTVCEAAVHQVYRHCEGKTSAFLDSFKPYIKHYKRCCSGKPSRIANKFGHFWNVTSLQADASYAEFSARIERNEDQSSVLQFNDPLVVSEA
ncbi:hypothetical protein HPB49_013788 [Dermacentor silvarum]|uniref:Uncharacterized protein n=1 Tax=Dermacentor silvarum TaxID=543639 RepID=A0ACB8C3X5_DERSI|nr:hypothetical protein HPB49_013788 [Dermacentor silvarum]